MSEVTAHMIAQGRPALSALARAPLAGRLRAVLARTLARTGDSAIDAEMARLFAQSRTTAVPGLALLGLAVALTFFFSTGDGRALVWMALLWSLQYASLRSAQQALAAPLDRTVALNRAPLLAEAGQGLVWAMLPLLVDGVGLELRLLAVFALVLVGAGAALVSAPLPLAVVATLAPTTLALLHALQPVWNGPAWPVAVMACGAQGLFLILALRLRAERVAALALRLEKDALIAELERATRHSDEARRRAEDANLAKSRFLATMSHELRTPLNAILGFSEVMKGELFGRHAVPAYRDYARDIHSSGQHLLMLINEILDLSRVEAGRYDLREDAVSLPQIVRHCLSQLAPRAEKRAITISESIDAALPKLWADEQALRQITLNLLSNAIKFTPIGGHVSLRCGWTPSGGQYLTIRDTGPGIPPHEIPIVLSSFGRGSLAQKNAEEGSGLGLTIVKGLVDLHGGTLTIESEMRGGAEVTVAFPAERVADAMAPMERPAGRRGASAREAA